MPTAVVTNVQFTDTDTDANQMGGNVTWTAPADVTSVTHYVIYASTDGEDKTTKLGEVEVGTNTFEVAENTELAQYIVVVCKNAAGEAATSEKVQVTDVTQ